MKVIEQDLPEKKKGRVFLATGVEEINLLFALLDKSLVGFPELIYPEDARRMRNMRKVMSVYLGKSKIKTPRSSETPCPKCERKVRGEKALVSHLRDVHSR